MTTIYLVRHGQSLGNANFEANRATENVAFGTPLTSLGREQAEHLAKKLKHVHFDSAFSSDLLRAKETAEIILLEKKLAVETRNAIRERSMANYAKHFPDKTFEELQEEIQKDLQRLQEAEKMSYKHSPHMESAEEAAGRLITFLREVAVAYLGKTVLVVNHGTNMRSLLTHLGFAKYDELPSGAMENTAYVVLESDGTDFFIKEVRGVTKQQGKTRGW